MEWIADGYVARVVIHGAVVHGVVDHHCGFDRLSIRLQVGRYRRRRPPKASLPPNSSSCAARSIRSPTMVSLDRANK